MQEPRTDVGRGAVSERTQAEGSRAFEEVYLQFAPRLRRVAMAKFGIAADDAESLVHDVFATFFMHAGAVEQVERYLIGAICNASRKHLKRADVLFCDHERCAAVPDDVLLRQIERKQLLTRMWARIGSRCRELLCRYYVNGESATSIAEALDSTPGSVAVKLHRCRKLAVEAYRAITGSELT